MSMQAILGNFSLILFLLTIITGVIWFLDVFHFARQRRTRADAALAEFDRRQVRLAEQGIKSDEGGARAKLETELMRQPTWIEYSGSFFPVIAIVFFLRSFVAEPFKIPSSSMVPTLVVGDLILVNKFTYGIRLPVINKKIIDLNDPQRGDVVVFKYPKDTSLDYIKRVVGVEGDRIDYRNKRLTVNGQVAKYTVLPDYLDEETLSYSRHFGEKVGEASYEILNDDRGPAYVAYPERFPFYEQCSYHAEGFSCTVPAGHYFVMGDNRDNSLDSRFWGFVPDKNMVGKAFYIWMNLGDWRRIGSFK